MPAALALATPSFVHAQAIAVPTAQQVEAMCPDVGSTGLSFGTTAEQMGEPLVARFTGHGDGFAPFMDATLDFSAFSGRLYAVTYTAIPDDAGEDDEWKSWSDRLTANLAVAGWEPVDLPQTIGQGYFEAPAMQKQVETQQGPLTLLVEYNVSREFSLACASKSEYIRNNAEALGELPADAPRPQRSAALLDSAPVVARPDCTDPELIGTIATMITKPGTLMRDIRKVFEQGVALSGRSERAIEYEERLGLWLTWTMTNSGKINDTEMWQVREAAAPIEDEDPELTAMLKAIDGAWLAFSKRDADALCLSYGDVLVTREAVERRKAERLHAINAALEAEAARRGIDVS